MTPSLAGCRVVVTREERGELGRLLDQQGATVVHVPLIEVLDVDPLPLTDALSTSPDWVVVTSAAGARRVAEYVRDRPGTSVAVVGTATARALEDAAGRPADLVPDRQLAAELVRAFERNVTDGAHVVVAQADRAAPTLVDGLSALGHQVDAVTAYRTALRRPDPDEIAQLQSADAVVFASGSAAIGWADAFGHRSAEMLPPIVVAIGPTSRDVASGAGVAITHTAEQHSLDGVIATLEAAWAEQSGRT